MTFNEDLTLREEISFPAHYGLAFCLEDPLYWRLDGGGEYEIGPGESYVFNGLRGSSMCTYYAGKRFSGISLQCGAGVLAALTESAGEGSGQPAWGKDESCVSAKRFSPGIRLILADILRCRYRGDIERIYLEGKALELLAVYLDEMLLENGNSGALPGFSKADIAALHHARSILDGAIDAPPTIRGLARLSGLNEYKLKAGFRELFGLPVYAYIINKRMESARLLMGERGMSVAEAALSVGYSSTNHFTEKFKAKYGVKPSEYRKLR
ncbi:helix-turn-helix transcriptional regulator [Sporobacter termitidis]|nr:AraC family transcriptional regulator [Sporobacter termitidis]